jgi:hypothetical protein
MTDEAISREIEAIEQANWKGTTTREHAAAVRRLAALNAETIRRKILGKTGIMGPCQRKSGPQEPSSHSASTTRN